jgi:hypothetical protein
LTSVPLAARMACGTITVCTQNRGLDTSLLGHLKRIHRRPQLGRLTRRVLLPHGRIANKFLQQCFPLPS